MKPEGWRNFEVRELVRALTTGVSVNSQSRPRRAGEIGILKTSAVTYGVFRPEENKVVVREELHRVRENPRAGCVLVSRMNTPALVGASAFVERDWPDLVLPDRIWQVLPDPARADGRWLSYLLAAPKTRAALSELASGTSGSMKNLAQEKFMSMNLLVPPLGEQKKIAAILSSVDEAIEATQAVIDQLQVVKKAMMAELLTRGLPGRHTRFKQTEIGEVPEEWHIVALGDLIEKGPDNGLYKPQSAYGRGTPIVRIDAFENGEVLKCEGLRLVQISPEELARFRLSKGDILINRVNSLTHLAKVALVVDPPEDTVFESNMMRLAVDESRVCPAFIFRVIASPRSKEFFLSRAKQAVAQASINQQDVRALPVPLPGRSEQEDIAALFERLDERVGREEEKLAGLGNLKTALMSALLTGEVRVKLDEEAA